MKKNNLIIIENDLRQIADMLLLNGTLTECAGLIHGKIGIAIFFFHYAQYTNNELFADYAMDLIGEIFNQIHVNSPADYQKGIAGIGVGIDYLIQNKFLSVENDIIEDLDQRIVRAVLYDPWMDFSQYDGLIGYGRYWMMRLRHPQPAVKARECLLYIIGKIEEELPNISIKEQIDVYCFLHDIQTISHFNCCNEVLGRCLRELNLQLVDITQSFPRFGDSIIANIVRTYQYNKYFNTYLQNEIDFVKKQVPVLDIEKAPDSTGLLNGYAGEGMLRLMTINQANISWMQLL
jgi:hypothetical protein